MFQYQGKHGCDLALGMLMLVLGSAASFLVPYEIGMVVD